ncbi:hypothetical protein GCM10019071_02900 [Sphingobium fuliginis]|uniref:Uncharacterized protein n=1 Tax=Sphingobium fuliginis (strain ATCC 27551) TaxID=336203 RepID=A0ABQ1EM06_SPHSA|nr:hypothetical protein GCM10019071_02900 [Sphingobium fuliginis]
MAGLPPAATGLEGSDRPHRLAEPANAIAAQAMSACDPPGSRVSDQHPSGPRQAKLARWSEAE